jgi:hypothetical protein
MTSQEFHRIQTRRSFLNQCAAGLGTAALAHLLGVDGLTAASVGTADPAKLNRLAPRAPHFAGRAKNVIFLFMEGAPSQMDLYDPKPGLAKYAGQSLPPSMTKDLKLAFIKPTATILPSPRKFYKRGQSGIELSDYLPHIGTVADDMCLVRSMHGEAFNHHPGQSLLMSGSPLSGRPTIGAWATYGLGSESQSLPGFVVLSSGRGTSGGSTNWSSGFLPSTYQGVPFRSKGDPILYLSNPPGVSDKMQRLSLDALRDVNEAHFKETGDLEIASRISAYELAFRMQSSGPELIDFSDEPDYLVDAYGINNELSKDYGTNCLLARRMVERGVRFVMLAHASWDDHTNLNKNLKKNCEITDQPIATLIKDLKQRGLLDSTLIVWGGEFGRTPLVQLNRPDDIDGAGRDHHPNGYSMWLAGGGIKGGQVIGETDELGLTIAKDPVHVHDLQATILHCLGFDHTKLTNQHQGRQFRLTEVGGNVVTRMLA